jgi:YidC/Oxa1 family membrane protein insertase
MIRDIQRYALIAAIAVLGFMLLTNWVHFRQKMAQEPQTATSAEPASEAGLPAVNTSETAATLVTPASINSALTSTGRYVSVRTDVLDLKIDLEGGDIISVALPQYSTSLETPDQAFALLQKDSHRTYIAYSGLEGRDGIDIPKTKTTPEFRPRYETITPTYELKDGSNELAVELTYETPKHVQIRKRFLFQRGQYVVGLNYRIDNLSPVPWEGALRGKLIRDNSADPSVVTGGLGMSSYLGAAAPTPKSTYEKLPFKKMAENQLNEEINGGWIGIIQHYFLAAWIPDQKTKNTYGTFSHDNIHIVYFTAPVQEIAAGSSGEFNARLYAGPKDQYALRDIAPGLELSVDYGYLFFIAQPIFWLLTKIHGVLGNWGWSIVGVTVIVKAMFFWLNAKAYMSMANMRKVQPKLAEIRERYADDRQKQSAEMMNLYKTEKINPLGGCLPIVVQMPVFLSLYWVLQESVELRHAPWILWITDLSAMDQYLILPLLMGATMFIQQKLNPPPPDPMQAKVMQWMPVMFTFFFLWFPAGLVLYWVVNNTLSIAQQYVITKRIVKNT